MDDTAPRNTNEVRPMERSIAFEQYVDVDFEAAATAMREQAPDLLLDDPDESTLVLSAEVAGFDVAREVAVTLAPCKDVDKHAVEVPISWEAVERPKRFPTFEGGVELSAMSTHPAQSQLALIGTVRPPLGVLGKVGEAAGGTQIGDAVLEALLGRVVERLTALVAERQARAAADVTPSHMSRPRFRSDD